MSDSSVTETQGLILDSFILNSQHTLNKDIKHMLRI